MTKFDIRLRRKQFTQSRIERHKNYQSLMERHYEASKKKTRGMMVVVFLIILVIAILLAFFGTWEAPKEEKPKENIGQITSEHYPVAYHEAFVPGCTYDYTCDFSESPDKKGIALMLTLF